MKTIKPMLCYLTPVQTVKKAVRKPHKAVSHIKLRHPKAPVAKAQKAAIYALLSMGIEGAEEIRQIMALAAKPQNFSHVSVAGCKAALTKGQMTPF